MAAADQQRARITPLGLFADIRGSAGAPPLLFLHGGPGQGCYDFMALQGERLAATARVIGLDQRGVDRSVPLPECAALAIADLVADCERAREALGIERWAVLGQSFGGMLALRYAAAHPAAVAALILENPVLDVALASRASLPRAAALLAGLGRDADAGAARAALDGGPSARALYAAHRAAMTALGGQREAFQLPSPGGRERLRRIHASRDRAAELRDAGDGGPGAEDAHERSTARHHLAITADDAFYESVLPLLPRLGMPALLITGRRDPVGSEDVRAAFAAASPANRRAEFGEAGHFVHADEPGAYAAEVTGFLSGHRVPGRARSSGW